MYSHITKGMTIGSQLTRRALRTITGIPGLAVDAVAALFWHHYTDYFNEATLPYEDSWDGEASKTSFCRAVTGWIGNIAGHIIGPIMGAAIGFVSYVPDAILSAAAWIHDKIGEGLNNYSTFVGERKFFNDFATFRTPQNYMEKAWNVATGSLGVGLGFALWAPVRFVENFLPFGHSFSNLLSSFGGLIGSVVGSLAAIPVYPAKYLLQKCVDGYRSLQQTVNKAVAFVYAKTATEPATFTEDCVSCHTAVHTQQFRDQVNDYKSKTSTEIIFGNIRPNTETVNEVKNISSADQKHVPTQTAVSLAITPAPATLAVVKH